VAGHGRLLVDATCPRCGGELVGVAEGMAALAETARILGCLECRRHVLVRVQLTGVGDDASAERQRKYQKSRGRGRAGVRS
jgi:hypothetical protein